MKNIISIMIERDGRHIEVDVVRHSTSIGYEEAGDQHVLTDIEQDDAEARLNADEYPEPDLSRDEHVFTVKDADRAADAYFGHRSGNR